MENRTERDGTMAKADTPPQDVEPVVTEPVAPATTTQAGEEYKTQGQTRVATQHGYAFRPSNQDLPVIDHLGVNVTKEQAEAVLQESERSDGRVYLVDTTEEV